MKRFGIIDLGSNSVRVCVTDLNKIFFSERNQVKLGKDMSEDFMLNENSIKRTISAFIEYKKIFDAFNVSEITAVATAALRKAKNSDFFVHLLEEKTGIKINIISGYDEAKYDFFAIKDSFNLSDFLIIDIGGGSTEIIGVKSGKFKDFISVPCAARNITEKYLTPETEQKIKAAENIIFKEISSISWLENYKGFPVVCIGGCLKDIGVAISKKNNETFVSGYTATSFDVFNLYNDLIKLSVENRINLVGKSKGDIIIGGLIPYVSILKIISDHKLIFTTKGVTDGIVYALKNKKLS